MPRSCRCPAFWRPCDRDQQGELTWRLQRRRPRRLRPSPPRPRPAPRRRPRRRRSNSIFPAPPGALTPQERSPGIRIFAPDRPDFLSGLSAFRPFDVARSPIRGIGDRCGRRPPSLAGKGRSSGGLCPGIRPLHPPGRTAVSPCWRFRLPLGIRRREMGRDHAVPLPETGTQPPRGILPRGSPFRLVDQFQEGVESHLQVVLEPLILLLEHQLAIAEMQFLGPFLRPGENAQE